MAAHKIMVLRHAEKPDDAGVTHAVDEFGVQDPRELTVRGWQRAGALVRFFAPRDNHFIDRRIETPGAIFAAAPHERSKRSPSTVRPLAQALGLTMRSEFSAKTQVAQMLDAAQACDAAVLVSWRHDSMREIAHRLLGDGAVSLEWDDARFDMVWVFSRSDDHWILEQVPQLLLPGDSEVPIEGRSVTAT
jgi:hypothetical protein